VLERVRHRRERNDIATHFERAFEGQPLRAPLAHVEHHESHLASAFYGSRF
jgi:predicted NodU family carbamoyl transferase